MLVVLHRVPVLPLASLQVSGLLPRLRLLGPEGWRPLLPPKAVRVVPGTLRGRLAGAPLLQLGPHHPVELPGHRRRSWCLPSTAWKPGGKTASKMSKKLPGRRASLGEESLDLVVEERVARRHRPRRGSSATGPLGLPAAGPCPRPPSRPHVGPLWPNALLWSSARCTRRSRRCPRRFP